MFIVSIRIENSSRGGGGGSGGGGGGGGDREWGDDIFTVLIFSQRGDGLSVGLLALRAI